MKASSKKFFHVKAYLILKKKQTFHMRRFGIVSRKSREAFYCWFLILSLKEEMNGHIMFTSQILKPNKILKYYAQ